MAKIESLRFLRAFQQLRALCLLALVLVHAFSYSTGTKNDSILNASYFPIFGLLVALNGAFIFISGVTFRMALNGDIEGDRLIRFPRHAFKALIALVALETIKNYFVYDSTFGFFIWDFLRTILVVALLCIILSRKNIYLNVFVAGLIAWFFTEIRETISAWLWRPEFGLPDLTRLNAAHFIYFGLGFSVIAAILWSGLKPVRPRLIKLLSVSASAILFAVLLRGFPYDLSLDQFVYYRDLPLTALIGDTRQHTLFPLLATGPSFLLAFTLTHFTLKHQNELKSYSPWVLFMVSATIWLALIYLLLIRHLDWILSMAGTTTWSSFRTDDLTSFAGEIMKSLTVVTGLLGFYLITAGIRSGEKFIASFGAASFWVYILTTTFTPYLVSTLSIYVNSTHWLFVITAVSTLILSVFITRFAAWFEGTRFKIAIRQHRKGGWTPLEAGLATLSMAMVVAGLLTLGQNIKWRSERTQFAFKMDQLSERLSREPKSQRFHTDGSTCQERCPIEVTVTPERGSPDLLIEFFWTAEMPDHLKTVRASQFDRRLERKNGEYVLKDSLCPAREVVVGFDGPGLPICVKGHRLWP